MWSNGNSFGESIGNCVATELGKPAGAPPSVNWGLFSAGAGFNRLGH